MVVIFKLKSEGLNRKHGATAQKIQKPKEPGDDFTQVPEGGGSFRQVIKEANSIANRKTE